MASSNSIACGCIISARDGHALPLPAGKLVAVVPGLVGKTDPAQVLQRPRLGQLRGLAQHAPWRQGQVEQHRQMRKQVVVLEHHAHLLAHLIHIQRAIEQVLARQKDLAGIDTLQQIRAAQRELLPPPLGPTMTITSPRRTLKFTPRSTAFSP